MIFRILKIICGLSFFFMVVAVITYGIVVSGSPFEARATMLDNQRMERLRQIENSVQMYASQHGNILESLADIKTTPGFLASNTLDPETHQQFEYSRLNEAKFQVCATFSTKNALGTEANGQDFSEFAHQSGHQCFEFAIPQQEAGRGPITWSPQRQYPSDEPVFLAPSPLPSPSPVPKPKFADKHIQLITTDAKNITYSNYPWGFFNDNMNDWGLINYNNDPVRVTVTFTQPVKISKISAMFSNCLADTCCNWSATGKTNSGTNMQLFSDAKSPNQADKVERWTESNVSSDQAFSSITFNINRIGGPDLYVHWKKLKFSYVE
jgi:hypothetical protein